MGALQTATGQQVIREKIDNNLHSGFVIAVHPLAVGVPDKPSPALSQASMK